MGSEVMRVLICDPHRLFAEALAAVLADRGHHVVGQVGTPAEAVDLLEVTQVDVCVMDLPFPAEDEVSGTAGVLKASTKTKVVLATAISDPAILARAVHAGARGLAVKGGDLPSVLDTVERVHGGEMVVDVLRWSESLARKSGIEDHHVARFLTPRERQVLEHLVEGGTTASLAEAMGVRCSTARSHIQSTLSKLGVHSRLEAVAYALSNGMVSPPLPR